MLLMLPRRRGDSMWRISLVFWKLFPEFECAASVGSVPAAGACFRCSHRRSRRMCQVLLCLMEQFRAASFRFGMVKTLPRICIGQRPSARTSARNCSMLALGCRWWRCADAVRITGCAGSGQRVPGGLARKHFARSGFHCVPCANCVCARCRLTNWRCCSRCCCRRGTGRSFKPRAACGPHLAFDVRWQLMVLCPEGYARKRKVRSS